MKTRDFAAKYIVFSKTSPVTGPFRLSMYPMLGAPMDASDDIRVKRLVIYKASSCLGTVLGQIINAKRIAKDVGDQIMVCQTDDDAAKFTKTRGREWLESIVDIERLVSSDKYAKTNDLWLFRHKFLKISGPGITEAQSDQVRYVQSDESHLDAYPPGRLVEFEKRMGARWDRQATHITTAANAGKEVDQFYFQATQNEWHWRCQNPNCQKLIWPLWEEDAKKIYNGERVFHFSELSEIVFAVCPHCQKTYADSSRERFSLQHDADYVSKNPTSPIEFASYRWSALSAAHWMPWREMRLEWYAALDSWKLGDLKPYEDFQKKRLCNSYTAEPPIIGEANAQDDYVIGSVWITEHEKLRNCSFDVQDEGGFHLWAQCDEWLRNGDSRRVDYTKLVSWEQARAFQQHHGALDADTYCDAGHRMREVFGKCATWKWYALFATDDDSFPNDQENPKGKGHPRIVIPRPYSMTQLEDSMAGKNKQMIATCQDRRSAIPAGYCLSRRWSKPVIGGYLMALKGGNSRYFGIAKDIVPEYHSQLNSYAYVKDYNKKFGTTTIILKQVKKDDHSFSTSSQCLLGAIIKKYFPLSNQETKPVIEIAA